METMISITLPFFALIGCGYAAARIQILPEGGIDGINVFVFYFALPALLFRTMATRPLADIVDPGFIGVYALTSLVVFAAGALIARLLFAAGLGGAALIGLAGVYSNSGYLGLPLVVAMLGEGAAVPIALALAVDLVLMVSIAIAALEVNRGGDGGPGHGMRNIARAVIFNPLVLSIGAGVAVSAAGMELVAPIETFTRFLSAAAGPAALFAIGASLVGRPLSSGLGEVTQMTCFKLIVHPFAVWAAMTLIYPVDPFWARATILVAALPVAGTVFVLGQRYRVYAARTSMAILSSTIAAMATFTVLVFLMGL